MIKAVVFDLDGTLINSLEDLAVATNYTMELNGYPTHPISDYNMFVGNGISKLIERAMPPQEVCEEKVASLRKCFLEYYNKHYMDKTDSYKGMPELVDYLHKEGYKLAVITNKVEFMAEKIITKLYGNSFDLIYGQRDNVPTKPDPTLTLMAMNDLNVTPQECAFLGDSGVDMKTAINSGALPIGVLWGFRDMNELKANGAKYIINEPCKLIEIINK